MSTKHPLDPAAKLAYEGLQSKHQYHWLIFKIQDNSITIDESCPTVDEQKNAVAFEYSGFANKLKNAKEPRYAVVNYPFVENGVEKDKVVFVLWASDNFGAKIKMPYSSGKEAFKKELSGLQKDLEAHDEFGLSEEELLKKCIGN